MPVSLVHPLYAEMSPVWRECRDAVAGQRAVKKGGALYLPATFADAAVGRDPAEFVPLAAAFARWLDDAQAPLPDWPGIDVLLPVRDFPARHGSVRLAFDAAAEAARGRSTVDAA